MKQGLPYAAIVLVYALGADLDIMEVDAAQYASISLEMLKSGNFLEVFDRHEPYLDKPPLLFWLSALSMKLLGVGSWQYRFPSILFSLLGILSTYQLGKLLYSEAVGRHASVILGASVAMVMINNDVKTDTILVSSIVFAIWMMVAYLQKKRLGYLIGAALGISAAMLTKGPIGLMMPVLAIGGHLLFKREWRHLFDPKWLLMLLMVAMLLTPMCLGLYRQFGAEGLKFFFWTQSFGRITGESSWQNDTSPLFFTHVFLWSFLPWSFLAIAALFNELKGIRRSLSDSSAELFLISGAMLVWGALSLSKFKLPHYIFVVYPLIAILTAKYLHQLKRSILWSWFQLILGSLVCLLLAVLLPYCFPGGGYWVSVVLILSVIGAGIYFFNSYRSDQLVVPSFMLSIAIGIALNAHFYPQLLPYQANAFVGKWVVKNNIDEDSFVGFATGGRALDFYAERVIPWMPDAESTIAAIKPGMVVYVNEERYADLIKFKAFPKREFVILNYPVQRLSVRFLDPRTRPKVVEVNRLLFY